METILVGHSCAAGVHIDQGEPRPLHSLRIGGYLVKLIVAVIKPFKEEEVRQALADSGVRGLTATEVQGFGRQKGHTELYRGAEYSVDFLPKVKLEIAVPDSAVQSVIDVIRQTANTGEIGDGKIFVLPLDQTLRIRTRETGDDAL
jgi:nitrogen regulatory protein P-II 2